MWVWILAIYLIIGLFIGWATIHVVESEKFEDCERLTDEELKDWRNLKNTLDGQDMIGEGNITRVLIYIMITLLWFPMMLSNLFTKK